MDDYEKIRLTVDQFETITFTNNKINFCPFVRIEKRK